MSSDRSAETDSFLTGISFTWEIDGLPDGFSMLTTVAAATAAKIIDEDEVAGPMLREASVDWARTIIAAQAGAQVAVAALAKADLLKPEALDKITFVIDKPEEPIFPPDDTDPDFVLTTVSPEMHKIFNEIEERTIEGSKE